MDYALFGVFALALIVAYIAGFNRGHREADEDWQKILAHKENLIFQLRLAQMRPLATPPKENE